MRYRMWHTVVLALLLGAQASLGTTEVRASGLVDWMSRCGRPADPQFVCYPMTTMYATSVTDGCAPDPCCASPDIMCCPPMAVVQPQARYRTSWKKIPVTSYRPVVATDPVTGCPVTVLAPCTTYTWQAERQRCGFLAQLFGWCDPPAQAVECCTPTAWCGPCENGLSAVSSGCCQPTTTSIVPVPESPSPTPAPYYAPNPPSAFAAPPGTGTPTISPSPSPAPTLAPSTPPAAGGSYPGRQPPAPADMRPALKPVEVPPDPARDPVPSTGLPLDHATPTDPATPAPQSLQPMPLLGPPVMEPAQSRLHPVPDPDATPVSPVEGEDNPPPLLPRRDQVASLRTGQHWTVTPIAWPASPRDREDRAPERGPRRDLREWDEGGWKSARKAP